MKGLYAAVGVAQDGALAPVLECDETLHDPSGGLTVAISGRIDGRSALAAACIAAGHPPRGENGIELVLSAYRAWGEDCPAHILGDYALVVWDASRAQLFCARDSAGVRPLFYVVTADGALRIATNASMLLEGMERKPDFTGLVDFLIGRGALLPKRTPICNLLRLPPGYALTFDRSGVRTRRYWSLSDPPKDRFATRDQSAEACHDALKVAIRDRVHGFARCGIQLSGGWDSGAIFVVWQALRARHTEWAEPWFYSYYGDCPESDERESIRALLARFPAEGEFVALEPISCIQQLERRISSLGMPEPASGWRYLERCAQAARSAGVTRVLNGEGGNEAFQSSVLRPLDLLRAGKFRDAYRQTQIWADEAETSLASFFWPFVIRPALTATLPAFVGASRAVKDKLNSRPRGFSHFSGRARELAFQLIAEAEARDRADLRGQALGSWDKRLVWDRWTRDLYPVPDFDSDGVAFTSPFLDRRVVESALAALDLECAAGSTRRLLAGAVEALTGVPFRGRHAQYNSYLERMLRSLLREAPGLFDAPALTDLGLLHPSRLRELVRRFDAGESVNLGGIFRLISAEIWARCCLDGAKDHSIRRGCAIYT